MNTMMFSLISVVPLATGLWPRDNVAGQPGRSRATPAVPSRPERSRAVPSGPERSRAALSSHVSRIALLVVTHLLNVKPDV